MLPARLLFGFGVAFRVVALVSVLSSVLFAASSPVAITKVPKALRIVDRFEPDDMPAQAKEILNGQTQSRRSLDIVGDVDWVRFTVPEPSHVAISATCVRRTLRITLYGPAAAQTALAEWTASPEGPLNTLQLEPGNFYMRVANDARTGTVQDYSLSLAITPLPREVQPVRPPVQPVDTPVLGQPLPQAENGTVVI